jgi:hypothetical protein
VAFQRLDINRDEFVCAAEIIQFLQENRVYDATLDEAKYVVNYFDTDEDSRLSYKE